MPFSIKTYDDIVTDLIQYIKSLQTEITDFSVGTVIRAIIEAMAYEYDESYYKLYQNFIAQFILSAKGTDLDNLVVPLGIARLEATASAGYIEITNTTPATIDTPIPAGTIVISRPDDTGAVKEYETTELKILKTGDIILKANGITIRYNGTGTTATLTIANNTFKTYIDSVLDFNIDLTDSDYDTFLELINEINLNPDYLATIDVESNESNASYDLLDVTAINIKSTTYTATRKDKMPIIATAVGPDYDQAEDQIIALKIPIIGIETITNSDPISGGKEIESDTDLRNRAINQMSILSLGIPETYEKWAKESTTKIIRAKTIPRPVLTGTVDILVVENTGIASFETIQIAQTYLDKKRCPSVTLRAIAFTYKPIDIEVKIILQRGNTQATTEPKILAAIRNYFSYANWNFGDDVYRGTLIDIISAVDGVYAVDDLIQPANNVPVALDQMPKIGIWTPTYTIYQPE